MGVDFFQKSSPRFKFFISAWRNLLGKNITVKLLNQKSFCWSQQWPPLSDITTLEGVLQCFQSRRECTKRKSYLTLERVKHKEQLNHFPTVPRHTENSMHEILM